MIGSCIIELRSHYSFDIVMSMGILTSSIYMSHIICSSPIYGNHINTKTKIHHVPSQEAPPLPRKSYDVCRPYDELLLAHIRGQSVNPKNYPIISTWPTPHKYIYFTTLIWPPHPCKGSKNIKKGLKTPKKSQNSSHRGSNLQKGAKTPQRSLKSPKELRISRKGLKAQKGAKALTRGLKP